MSLKLKKSRISNWWIAHENDKMNFFNIFSQKHFNSDFVVMGYLDKNTNLARSTNLVMRVTKEGVITAQGTFYPFEEAHPLYLKFLLQANKPNTIIASHWEILDEKSHTMIANIETSDGIKNNITFDFIPDKKTKVMFSGYSHKLSANVVLSSFRRRGYCVILSIPETVLSDIATSSIILQDDLMKRVRKVEKLFEEKFGISDISVDLS